MISESVSSLPLKWSFQTCSLFLTRESGFIFKREIGQKDKSSYFDNRKDRVVLKIDWSFSILKLSTVDN